MGLHRKGKDTHPRNETVVTACHVLQLLHLDIPISQLCQFRSCNQTWPWHIVQMLPPKCHPMHEAY